MRGISSPVLLETIKLFVWRRIKIGVNGYYILQFEFANGICPIDFLWKSHLHYFTNIDVIIHLPQDETQ